MPTAHGDQEPDHVPESNAAPSAGETAAGCGIVGMFILVGAFVGTFVGTMFGPGDFAMIGMGQGFVIGAFIGGWIGFAVHSFTARD